MKLCYSTPWSNLKTVKMINILIVFQTCGPEIDARTTMVMMRLSVFVALQAPVLDFGKIIIYTSNLKIVRAPHKKRESGRSPHRSRDRKESSPRRTSRSKDRNRTACSHAEEPDETTAQKISVWRSVDCKQFLLLFFILLSFFLVLIIVHSTLKLLKTVCCLWSKFAFRSSLQIFQIRQTLN